MLFLLATLLPEYTLLTVVLIHVFRHRHRHVTDVAMYNPLASASWEDASPKQRWQREDLFASSLLDGEKHEFTD